MMHQIGTEEQPLRVAVVGAGPAGFYAADHLLKSGEAVAEVDLFDRLPTPFGLVRGGVAPDHLKIKSVTRVFDKVAAHPRFRFFGNVEFGRDLTLDDMKRFYHAVYFSTGAQTDRSLGIPGEELSGSHSATEFVAWYNGHPDYRDLKFDLDQERAVIVGVGNVAIDVARILCRTPRELMETDIAAYAMDALSASKVREIYVLGRRGPAQAAFTNPEVRELGELEAADIVVLPDEVQLDDASLAALEEDSDRTARRNVEILQEYAEREPSGKPKKLFMRFLVSPIEIHGEDGHVSGVRIVRNRLVPGSDGSLRPRPTEHFEELPAGLVFRSVGYRGVALPEVPFDEAWGTIPNEAGRVLDARGGSVVQGLYVGGWIKRGPSGVIGTNKPDAIETAAAIIEDAVRGSVFRPEQPGAAAVEAFIRKQRPDYFSYEDWQHLDACELRAGKAAGRPRVKLTCLDDMAAALKEERSRPKEDSPKAAARPSMPAGAPGRPGGPPPPGGPKRPPSAR